MVNTPIWFPVADTAETVGHVDTGSFLPGEDGADALLGHGVDELLFGEGGDPFHPFQLQDPRDHGVTVH